MFSEKTVLRWWALAIRQKGCDLKKSVYGLALACCAVLLFGASAVLAATLPDTIARVKPSVVAVGTAVRGEARRRADKPLKFSGTGFVVGNGLQVITNYHVVDKPVGESEQLAVFSGEGKKARARFARVIAVDKANDLALLEIAPPVMPALKLGRKKLRDGELVAFSGFPLGFVLGLNRVTHRGIVSAVTPMVTPVPDARHLKAEHIRRLRASRSSYVYQLDANAYPGNSGSPMYDPASGEVLGVINSVFIKKTKEAVLTTPTGITYAIPVEHARALLAR